MGKSPFAGTVVSIEPLEGRQLLAGNGLAAQYFNNRDLTGSSIRRVDPIVNFEWGTGSPSSAIGADTFSARWTGQVSPETSGSYTFYTQTNDGVRLWVNGVRLIDKWVNQSLTEWKGSINLQAGRKYSLRMEFFENTGTAAAKLLWSGPGVSKRVIPTGRLFNEFSPEPTPLAVPTGLTAKATGPRRVELSWNDVAGEAGYKVERRLHGTDDWRQIGTTGANVTKFVDERVEPGKTYIYRVRPFNGDRHSPYSNRAATTTPREGTTPAAPTELRVVEIGSNFVRLAWNNVVGETGYKIERRLDGTPTWTQIGTTPANVTTFLDDRELIPGKTYVYRVRAHNGELHSPYSNTVAARIPGGEDRPAAPRELRVTGISNDGVALAWNDVVGETGYEIQRRVDGSPINSFAKIGQTEANVTTFIDRAVQRGKTYIYRVIAFNNAGRSEPSNTAFATIPGGDDRPAAPRELRVTGISNDGVSLAWNDVAGEAGYEVQRRIDGSLDGFVKVGQTGANVTTFIDRNVEPGKTYIYQVIAFNNAGRSEPSNRVAATIPAGPVRPAAPRELHVTEISLAGVSLAWVDVVGETGYEVQRRLDGSPVDSFAKVGQTDANVTSFTDDDVEPAKTYIYRVIAFNDAGRSEPSNRAAATIPAAPGTPDGPREVYA